MNLPAIALSTALSFLFLALVFIPLEKAFPAWRQKTFRPAWFTDLAFFAGQYFLWTAGVIYLLGVFQRWLDPQISLGFRAAVAAQPWWLQVVEVVLLSDVLIYWGHRIQHRVDFLWRFHAVHHSAEHLDWLAAHREHPLDTVYTMGLINLSPFILGFPLQTIAGFLAFRGLWAIYIHSNVRLNIGPVRWLLGSPELHHWHHARARFAGNYANISPLMDLLFRTHHCPAKEPKALGLTEAFPRSYLGQMLHPFRRRFVSRRDVAIAEPSLGAQAQ